VLLCCPVLVRWCVLQGMADAGLGGVLLGGNYVAGVALGKCVEYGYEFADQVAQYVSTTAAAAPAAKEKVAA
jgi:oxygen-dependent protoporphyrinogen oxidase